jgi:hypothetical protein
MLNVHNLNIAALASSEEIRFTLNGILVAPDRTVVTDGHCLVQVTTPTNNGDVSNFPQVPGMGEVTDKFKPFIMPRAAALALAKAIPRKSTIPVLCHAAVAASSTTEIVTMGCTDLEKATVLPIRPCAGNFPDVSRVMPKPDDAIFAIILNLSLLTHVLSVITKMHPASSASSPGFPAATFRFYGHDRQVRIDFSNSDTGQDITAIVMPCRPDDNIKLRNGGAEKALQNLEIEIGKAKAALALSRTKAAGILREDGADPTDPVEEPPVEAPVDPQPAEEEPAPIEAAPAPADVPPLSEKALSNIIEVTGMPKEAIVQYSALPTAKLQGILERCRDLYGKADNTSREALDLNLRVMEGILEDRAVAA